ncbi:CDP-glycerol glycerophosphotransferase family protein [Niallia sp. NCCP-28]|uniref:CDP-glycerol glycerophosphotransferase family protein n=1 Tax=Niallia sp. NCCP-28 TaxID=2934712 RepID=UPI0020840057|nr:CDP-glycerol glycerophosphotransferase family protein [Niallia sp. NCCP-28]GKU83427.1 CDP-glycerol glycerophosphotransferase [Niallia sp. NCCP-28]
MVQGRNKKRITIDQVSWDGNVLIFTLPSSGQDRDSSYHVVLKNRKKQNTIKLNAKIKQKKDNFVFKIDLNQLSQMGSGRWDFYLESKQGKVQQRIGLYNAPVASEKIRYLSPILTNTRADSMIPYLTERNGLSIHSGNLFFLEEKSFNIVNYTQKVKEIRESKPKVYLHLKNKIPFSFGKTIHLYMKNKGEVCSIPFMLDSSRKMIIINKKDLAMLNKNKKWNVYLEGYKGKNLERSRLNIQLENKENKFVFSLKKKIIQENNLNKKFKGQLHAENYKLEGNNIKFQINAMELELAKKATFFLKKRKSSEKLNLQINSIVNNGKEEISIPISQLDVLADISGRWDLSVKIQYDFYTEEKRIGLYNTTINSEIGKIIGYKPIVSQGNGVSPYLTKDHELSFYFCTEEQYINSKYPAMSDLSSLQIEKGVLRLTATVKMKETDNFVVKGIALRLRQDKSRVILAPKEQEVSVSPNVSKFTVHINLEDLILEQFYWDFYAVVDVSNGEQRFIRLHNHKVTIKQKLKHRMIKYSIVNKENYMIYPYITINNCLSITYRQMGEYESLKYKINEYTAFILYHLLFIYFQWKPVWLIHEKYSETAQDNSFYFFKYCYENHKEKNIYYVIKKGSPDEKNLEPYKKNVVYFMSTKHLILLLASKLIISSESKGHGYAWRVSTGVIRQYVDRKKFVFLQHGVLGLKRVDNTFKAGSATGADMFVVSSDFEKKIVETYFDYKEEDIIVTGLARWDVVQNKIKDTDQKEILLMPTWRNWLEEVDDEQFISSEYYQQYNAILQSEDLYRVLKEQNIILNFYVHPKFMPYVSNFTKSFDNIRIYQFGEARINDLLMRSSLLITDYSSVAWEMYYQKKPTLFFHFDLEKYMENQGSYMDLKKDIFGEVAYTAPELIGKLNMFINNSFQEKEEYSSIRGNYFKYIDQNNSERIFKQISLKEKEITAPESFEAKVKRNLLLRAMWRKYNERPLVRQLGKRLLNILN